APASAPTISAPATAGLAAPSRRATANRYPSTPVSRPATTAIAQNQTSAPKNARVSALTTSAVPVPISWSAARGASSPQIRPPRSPITTLPASTAAPQAAVERAVERVPRRPCEPGTSGTSGTIAIPDIPPRFPPVIVRGNARRAGIAPASAGLGTVPAGSRGRQPFGHRSGGQSRAASRGYGGHS